MRLFDTMSVDDYIMWKITAGSIYPTEYSTSLSAVACTERVPWWRRPSVVGNWLFANIDWILPLIVVDKIELDGYIHFHFDTFSYILSPSDANYSRILEHHYRNRRFSKLRVWYYSKFIKFFISS